MLGDVLHLQSYQKGNIHLTCMLLSRSPSLDEDEAVFCVESGVELGLCEVEGDCAGGVLERVLPVGDLRQHPQHDHVAQLVHGPKQELHSLKGANRIISKDVYVIFRYFCIEYRMKLQEHHSTYGQNKQII